MNALQNIIMVEYFLEIWTPQYISETYPCNMYIGTSIYAYRVVIMPNLYQDDWIVPNKERILATYDN